MRAVQIVSVPEQALFYTGDASKYLGISPNTLRKRADLGLIPCKQDENGRRVFLLEVALRVLSLRIGSATGRRSAG